MKPEPQTQERLIGIEILRFICALAVLIWHYQHFSYISDGSVKYVLDKQPFFNQFSLLYTYGFYGVQVFWCISGFIFFWKYGEVISRKQISFKKFAELRFSRLYPLHFVTLLFVALMQFLYVSKFASFFVYGANDSKHFVLQLFLASDWGFQEGPSFNGPIWSISLEILAYLFFFVASRFISANIFATLGLLILSGALMTYHVIDLMVIQCIFYFYLGGMTAHIYQKLSLLPARWLKPLNILAALSLGGLFIGQYYRPIDTSYFVILAAPVSIYVLLHCARPINKRVIEIITMLGNLTYSSYLLHFPIQIVTVYILRSFEITIPFYSGWFFITFIAVTFFASYYCYKYFEMPAQNKIRAFFKTRTVTANS